jgi:GNAT superfamily N-acetyltransferase
MNPGLRLKMVREGLEGLPALAPPPRKLVIRPYAPGDEAAWSALVDAAYPELAPEPARFASTFGDDPAGLPGRMGFLVAGEGGTVVGTATAWSGGKEGRADQGRIHWVAIHPDYQGAGLSRPLVTWALHRLAALGHRDAYLMTEDFRLPAIGLYLSLGFRPEPRDATEAEAWRQILPLLAGRDRPR